MTTRPISSSAATRHSKRPLIIPAEDCQRHHETLRHHPANPRIGNVALIRQSIERHGFYGRLLVQRSSGYIVAGNHRFRAGREAGIELFPCRVLDVDDLTARRILIADNRTQDLADYDVDRLTTLVRQFDGDLDRIGYSADDYRALCATPQYDAAVAAGAVPTSQIKRDDTDGLTIGEYELDLTPAEYAAAIGLAKEHAHDPDDPAAVGLALARLIGLVQPEPTT